MADEPLTVASWDHLQRLASQILDQRMRETDTLVAKFIVEHPELKADQIELVEERNTYGGARWYVRKRRD